jgi:protein angel
MGASITRTGNAWIYFIFAELQPSCSIFARQSQSKLRQNSFEMGPKTEQPCQWDFAPQTRHSLLSGEQQISRLFFKIHKFNFQEVQKSHLKEIHGRLRSMSYEVIYKKRTGDKLDGCAVFFNRNLFTLLESHKIEFEQPEVEVRFANLSFLITSWKSFQLLNRKNVAVVCKFELISDPSMQFIVATTYLFYRPKRQDIRLAQVQVLLAELDRIAKCDDQVHLPIILTGDFNFQPNSPPYNLIVNGELNYENLSHQTLITKQNENHQPNGKILLPIKLCITDECQHVNDVSKVSHKQFQC